ncbi:enoyl-CoA-hydratase DpgB [Streptomyces sp. NPDC012825]|uniref:enoyl-CoA-hydratase DpgB n=1 Tax=Streptomyces sp. NPDC012825 TaxID=3364851 RepID=UPI0036A9477B
MREETVRAVEVLEVGIDAAAGLTRELIVAVGEVCDRAEDGQGAVVVLRTLGAAGHVPALDTAVLTKWEGVLRRLERLPAVSVAAMSRPCGGVALDAAMAADYRVAHPETELVLSTASGEVWPGMALYRMSRLSQRAPVRRAALFGMPVSAHDALAAGLVDELSEEPVTGVARLVGHLSGGWGADLAIRRDLLRGSTAEFEGALGGHLAACDRVLRRAASV